MFLKWFSNNFEYFCLQVALVYQVDDPINFMTSFYGCLIAGIIPVPIEPPASKDVSNIIIQYEQHIFITFTPQVCNASVIQI